MGSRLRPLLLIATDGVIPQLDFPKMSSKTPIPKDLGEHGTYRQEDRERLILKAKVASLEAGRATLEQELVSLRVESALELQDKDAMIEKLRTTKGLTGPSKVPETQNSERPGAKLAQEVNGSPIADLEASIKAIRERDELIQGLQKRLERHEQDRPITEGVVRDDHLLKGQVEQLQHYHNKLMEQSQQLQSQNDILKDRLQQAEHLTKTLLKQLDTLLAVTENLMNNEDPRQVIEDESSIAKLKEFIANVRRKYGRDMTNLGLTIQDVGKASSASHGTDSADIEQVSDSERGDTQQEKVKAADAYRLSRRELREPPTTKPKNPSKSPAEREMLRLRDRHTLHCLNP